MENIINPVMITLEQRTYAVRVLRVPSCIQTPWNNARWWSAELHVHQQTLHRQRKACSWEAEKEWPQRIKGVTVINFSILPHAQCAAYHQKLLKWLNMYHFSTLNARFVRTKKPLLERVSHSGISSFWGTAESSRLWLSRILKAKTKGLLPTTKTWKRTVLLCHPRPLTSPPSLRVIMYQFRIIMQTMLSLFSCHQADHHWNDSLRPLLLPFSFYSSQDLCSGASISHLQVIDTGDCTRIYPRKRWDSAWILHFKKLTSIPR